MRAACIAVTLAMAVLWLAAPGPAAADRQRLSLPEGVYIRSHTIDYFDGKRLTKTKTTDVLKLSHDARGKLEFCFQLIFTNGHSCTMEGKLVKTGPATWEHREKLESGAQCILRITYTGKSILIKDVSDTCRTWWCGARGYIRHVFDVRNRQTGVLDGSCADGR